MACTIYTQGQFSRKRWLDFKDAAIGDFCESSFAYAEEPLDNVIHGPHNSIYIIPHRSFEASVLPRRTSRRRWGCLFFLLPKLLYRRKKRKKKKRPPQVCVWLRAVMRKYRGCEWWWYARGSGTSRWEQRGFIAGGDFSSSRVWK